MVSKLQAPRPTHQVLLQMPDQVGLKVACLHKGWTVAKVDSLPVTEVTTGMAVVSRAVT